MPLTIQQYINGLYISLYDRAADSVGHKFWVASLGVTEAAAQTTNITSAQQLQLASQFVSTQSTYFTATYGPLNNSQFVEALYQNLGGRAGDADGVTYWSGELNKLLGQGKSATDARVEIAARFTNDLLTVDLSQFVTSLTASDLAAAQARQDAMLNKLAVSIAYQTNPSTILVPANTTDAAFLAATRVLDSVNETSASRTSAINSISAAVTANNVAIVGTTTTGTTFTLTTGEDQLTGSGGADIFTAPVVADPAGGGATLVTFQNFDNLNGGDGADTLNLTLGTPAVAGTLSSIETVNVRAVGAGNLSLANATGVTSLNFAQSTAAGTASNVGTVATWSVKNQNQDVTFTGNKATTVGLTLDTVGTSTVQRTITADAGITTLNLTANNAHAILAAGATATTATIASTGANTINLGGASGSLTALTITGAGSTNLASSGVLTALKTLTAGAATGAVTATVFTPATSVTTGTGADAITYAAAIGATAKVDLGAGNDTFTIAAATGKGATVAGGDGTDTLGITNGAFLDANAKAVYTGFEQLEIASGTGTYDMDQLPGLTAVMLTGLSNVAATTISNAVAGTTFTINSAKASNLAVANDVNYVLKTKTGTADAVTITLNGTDGDNDGVAEGAITASKIFADSVESVTIAANIASIDTGKAATDYTHTVTTLSSGTLATLTVTGNTNVVVGNALDASVRTINASGLTGGLSVNASAATGGVSFQGGAAKDTYIGSNSGDVVNAGTGGDVITLGAGVDTIIMKAGDSLLNAKANGHDVITAFTPSGLAADIIDLGAFAFTGTQASALANKGALANSVIDGTALTQAGFFNAGGVNRGVAIGTNGGNTYVFIDADKDGNFGATTDLMVQLVGAPAVTLANFGF